MTSGLRKYILILLAMAVFTVSLPVPVSHSASLIIAAVLSSDQPRYRNAHRSLQRALAAKGYGPDTVEFITQVPNPDPISWSNTIRKFNAVGANIIIAYGSPAAVVALQESQDIPIVFVDVYGPQEVGLAKSMSGSGVNAAGVSSKVPLATLVKTAMEFKTFRQIGVLYSSREAGSVVQLKELKRLAVQHGFSVVESNVPNQAALDSAISSVISQVDCLFATEASTIGKNLEKVIRRATESRVPVITQIPEGADKGALISLEANPAEMGIQAAEIVTRVLGGKKPALLPIATPRKVDLVINARTARALDLHVSLSTLEKATRVIK
jgi:putative ABC transport system substrate-binding protein